MSTIAFWSRHQREVRAVAHPHALAATHLERLEALGTDQPYRGLLQRGLFRPPLAFSELKLSRSGAKVGENQYCQSDTRSRMNQPAQIPTLGTSFICWELSAC